MHTQIAKIMGPTWGPPGSCRPQMGPWWPHENCNEVIKLLFDVIIHSRSDYAPSLVWRITRRRMCGKPLSYTMIRFCRACRSHKTKWDIFRYHHKNNRFRETATTIITEYDLHIYCFEITLWTELINNALLANKLYLENSYQYMFINNILG